MLRKQEGIRQIWSQPLGNSLWGEGDHDTSSIYSSAWQVLSWGTNRVLWESGKIFQKKCPLGLYLKNELEVRVEGKAEGALIMKAGGEKVHAAFKEMKEALCVGF